MANLLKPFAARHNPDDSVDYTLITSPENINQTRQRLSKLLTREKVLHDHSQRQPPKFVAAERNESLDLHKPRAQVTVVVPDKFRSSKRYVYRENEASTETRDEERDRTTLLLVEQHFCHHQDLLLARCLAKWRLEATLQAEKRMKSNVGVILSCATELIRCVQELPQNRPPSNGPNGPAEVSVVNQCFLRIIEQHVAQLFPKDVVFTSCDISSLPRSFFSGNSNENVIAVNPSFTFPLSDEGLRGEDSSHQALLAVVRYHPQLSSYNIQMGDTSNSSSVLSSLEKIVGVVRVTRSGLTSTTTSMNYNRGLGSEMSGSDGRFTWAERQTLSQLAGLASSIYASLREGLRLGELASDRSGQLSTRLVQMLLGASLGQKGALEKSLPALAFWLKHLCGGDLALVRLFSPSNLSEETTKASFQLLVSSEDCQPIDKDLKKLPRVGDAVQETLLLGRNEAFSTEVSSGGGSQDQLLVRLLKSSNGPKECVGELKILGSKLGYDSDQIASVELIAMALQHAMSTSRILQTGLESSMASTDAVRKLEETSNSLSNDVLIEKGQSESLRKRLSGALALVVFLNRLAEIQTQEQMSGLISETLPAVCGVTSAVLLVPVPVNNTVNSTNEVAEAHFRVFGDNRSDDEAVLPWSRLVTIPNYTGSTVQSLASTWKLAVKLPGSKLPDAIVVLSVDGGKGSAATSISWNGLEDILVTSIQSALVSCVKRLEVGRSIGAINETLRTAENIHREKQLFVEEIRHLQEVNNDVGRRNKELEEEIASLKAQLTAEKAERESQKRLHMSEVDELKAKMVEASKGFSQQLQQMEQFVREDEQQQAILMEEKKELMDLVVGYCIDPRCHRETVLQWLNEIADKANSSVSMVAQGPSGVLQGGPLEKYRGVMAAVGEAIRNGQAVEVITTISQFSSPFSVKRHTSDRSLGDLRAQESEPVTVLCVPNRSVVVGTETPCACFVFARVSTEAHEAFSSAEKSILECAASLGGTTLSRSPSELTAHDFECLEMKLYQESNKIESLNRALAIAHNAWSRGCKSRSDVVATIESSVCSLLTRGSSDPCSVQAFFWCPAWGSIYHSVENQSTIPVKALFAADDISTYRMLTQLGYASEAELVNRVISAGQSIAKVGVLWAPFRNANGDVVALLRAERKFSSESSSASGSTSQNPSKFSTTKFDFAAPRLSVPSLSDLTMTADDEAAMMILVQMIFPLLDRISVAAEAVMSVQEASQAISALQEIQSALEERAAAEVGHRIQLQEALKAGAEVLSMSSPTKHLLPQVIETARKSLLSVTSSDECLFISPALSPQSMAAVSSEAFPSRDHLTRKSKISAARKALAKASDQHDAFREFDRRANDFFVYDGESTDPSKIQLESSDVETRALRSGRFAVYGQVTVEEDLSNCSAESWAHRRLKSKNGNYSSERKGFSQPVHGLAFPVQLPSGAIGVLSLIRRCQDYDAVDKECVRWISSTLSQTIDNHFQQQAFSSTRDIAAFLEAEYENIAQLERRVAQEENELLELQQTLYESMHVRNDGENEQKHSVEEKIHELARMAVGSDRNIEVVLEEVDDGAQGRKKSLSDLSARPNARSPIDQKQIFHLQTSSAKIDCTLMDVNAESSSSVDLTYLRILVNHEAFRPFVVRVEVQGQEIMREEKTNSWVLDSLWRMRVTLFLKFLDVEAEIQHNRRHLDSLLAERADLTISAQRNTEEGAERHNLEINRLNVEHKELLDLVKTKYKRVLKDQSKIASVVEELYQTYLNSCIPAFIREVRQKSLTDRFDGLRGLQAVVKKLCLASSLQAAVGLVGQVKSSPSHVSSGLSSAFVGLEVTWPSEQENSGGLRRLSSPSKQQLKRDDPVVEAVSTGAFILFVAAEDVNSTRSALQKTASRVSSDQLSKRLESLIVSPANAAYGAGTVIAPMPGDFEGKTAILICHIRSHQSRNNDPSSAPNESVPSMVCFAVLDILNSLSTQLTDEVEIAELFRNRLMNTFSLLERRLSPPATSFAMLHRGFAAFKMNLLQTRAALLPAQSAKLESLANENFRLEKSLADWTQLAKGLGGPMVKLRGGLKQTWSQISPILTTMLSSYLSLRSCGLITRNFDHESATDNVIELATKDIGTPFLERGGDSGSDRSEGSIDIYPGVVEMNSISGSYGRKVEEIVHSLLRSEDRRQQLQQQDRIVCLVRSSADGSDEDDNDIEEQLWLVPIRCGREVLGLIRVNVDVHLASHKVGFGASQELRTPLKRITRPSTPISRRGSRFVPSNESAKKKKLGSNLEECISAAQNVTMNFATLLTPMLSAARYVERLQCEGKVIENGLHERNEAHIATMEELKNALESFSLLSKVILGCLSIESASTTMQSTDFDFVKSLCAKLGEILHCNVNLDLNSPEGTETAPSAATSGPFLVPKHRPPPVPGKKFRTTMHSEQLSLNGRILGVLNVSLPGSDDDVVGASTAERFEELKLLLQPIAALVSFIISSRKVADSKISGELQLASLTEELHNLNQIVARAELERREQEIHFRESMHYWEHLEHISNTAVDFLVREEGSALSNDNFYQILNSLCADFSNLLRVPCSTQVVLKKTEIEEEPNTSTSTEEIERIVTALQNAEFGPKLLWISCKDQTSEDSLFENVRRNDKNFTELAENLVLRTLDKKSHSVVDVNISIDRSTTAARVITLPIFGLDEDNLIFGVLQISVILPAPESVQSWTMDPTDHQENGPKRFNELTDHFSSLLTRLFCIHTLRRNKARKLQSLEENFIVSESSRIDAETRLLLWEQRANAWQGVTNFAVEVCERSVRGASFENILNTDKVAAAFLQAGLFINVASSSGELHYPIRNLSPGAIQSTFQVEDTTKSRQQFKINIGCQPSQALLVTQHANHDERGLVDGISFIAQELVNSVEAIARGAYSIQATKSAEALEAYKKTDSVVHKAEKLRGELKTAKEELASALRSRSDVIEELKTQGERCEKMHQLAVSSVADFCIPIVTEVSSLLSDLNSRSIDSFMQHAENKLHGLEKKEAEEGFPGNLVWEGLAAIGERAVTRVIGKTAAFNISILVRQATANENAATDGDIVIQVYRGAGPLSLSSTTSGNSFTLRRQIEAAVEGSSAVMHCFHTGALASRSATSHPYDIVGLSSTDLNWLKLSGSGRDNNQFEVVCLPIFDGSASGVNAVLRFVSASSTSSDPSSKTSADSLARNLQNPLLEVICLLGGVLSNILSHQRVAMMKLTESVKMAKEDFIRTDYLKQQLNRCRRLHRVVCREASSLLDPPNAAPEASSSRVAHPASLSPAAASQDVASKVLFMMRTLLRSEGQAMVLRDFSAETPAFQLIYSGNAIRWKGTEQSLLSSLVITGPHHQSLVESVLNTHKTIHVDDVLQDDRYNSALDGICGNNSPGLFVPLRGRGGGVVGVLIGVRGAGAEIFNAEDVIAGEMASAFGSVALYWCQGLGSLHHKLAKQMAKVDKLEKMMKTMQQQAIS